MSEKIESAICTWWLVRRLRLPDCQGFTFRAVGSLGKRDRRVVRHIRDGSYNLPSVMSSRAETRYLAEARNEFGARRDFHYARNSRVLPMGSNTDSGLGESTPQDFSSCCSSSADSTRPVHVVRIDLVCCLLFFLARYAMVGRNSFVRYSRRATLLTFF